MDYISRDLLLQKLKSFYEESKPFAEYRVGYDDCICAVQDLVSDMPTVEISEERLYLIKIRRALSGVKVFKVKTNNIYRIIGKIYSTSLKKIDRVDYSRWSPEREQFWRSEGFTIDDYTELRLSED